MESWNNFAEAIKKKYPGSYDDVDNQTLAAKMLEKHPEYLDRVDTTGLKGGSPAAPSASPAPEQPAMLPKLSGRFFTKEAQAAKLDHTGGKRKQMQAAYQADLARWKSLPDDQKMGGFDQWVETVYAPRTKAEAARARKADPNSRLEGREAPGVGKGIFRRFANITAAKGENRGAMPVSPLLQAAFTGVGSLPQKLNEAAYRVAGGQSQEDRDIANYMRLRTPIEKRGLIQSAKDLGDAAASDTQGFIREMFNPDDIGVNALSMVPVAGEAGLGTKVARLMTSAPGKVAAKVIASAPAELAASAAVGGGLNAVAGDEGVGTDFLMGAVPGVAMGLSGMAGRKLAGAASDALANRVSKGTHANLVHPAEESLSRDILKRASTPEEIVPPTAQDIFSNPDVLDVAKKSSSGLTTYDVDFLKKIGPTVFPGIEAFPEDKQIGKIQESIKEGAKRFSEESKPKPSDTKAQAKLEQSLESARQSLPSFKENADAWYSMGTKKEQDSKLIKASRAYRLLREHGKVEADPRFEGKTEVDLLAERLKQAQKEADDVRAAKAETDEQKALKDEFLKENKFRSDALLNEIDWAQKREQTLSDINFAGTIQMAHKVPGRILDEFKNMPVEHQGIFLRDIADMGSAGEYVRTALGPLFDDLQRIAGTSGYDPKRLRAKINEAVQVIKSTYGGGIGGLNGEVGGAPAGRSQAPGQQPSEGVYRDVPHGSVLPPMGASVEGSPQGSIGYAEPGQAPSPVASPQQAITGSAPDQIGYDPSRSGGQINLPDQSTGNPPIAMRDEPIGSRNELLGDQSSVDADRVTRREKLLQGKDEKEIQKILYDEILKDPAKAELFGIDRDIAIEAADPNSPFKGDLKSHLVDAAASVKKSGVPKGFF